jgi:hypothetical protein
MGPCWAGFQRENGSANLQLQRQRGGRQAVASDLRSSTIDGPATDGGGGALGLTSDLIAPWMDRQTDLGFRFTAGFPLHIDRR